MIFNSRKILFNKKDSHLFYMQSQSSKLAAMNNDEFFLVQQEFLIDDYSL